MKDGTQLDEFNNQIGFKVGTRMYRFLRESEHMFRGDDGTPRAWTIGAIHLDDWVEFGIREIVILDRETDLAWFATTDTWYDSARLDAKDPINGEQYYLEPQFFEVMKGWVKEKARHER